MIISKKDKGIIFIIISAFCFALMNMFVRLSGDVPVLQKCFFRNVVAVFVSFFMVLRIKGNKFSFEKKNWIYVALRALAGTLGVLCNYYSLSVMNITDASILNKLSPFFALIFSYLFLKERADKWAWISVILAFIGSLFVIKPSFSSAVIPALCAALGGLAAGFAYAFMRKASLGGVHGSIIIFCFSLFTCLITLPFVLFDYYPMSNLQLIYLLSVGVCATGGQIFITAAYANAPAKDISVFDYTIVIFTAILGFVFLDQIPDVLSFIGYAIIISAAIAKWKLSNKDEKKAKKNCP